MLTVSEKSGSSLPILPEDSYPAICDQLIDLGDQYSDVFNTTSRKVLIGWSLPGEKLEDGGCRRISNTYTASLSQKGNLRKMLVSWRGREFTADELNGFNLRNILGKPCLLQIIHKENKQKQVRAVVGGIMKLPKGMQIPVLEGEPYVFDLDDADAMEKIKDLPDWIAQRVKESETWKQMESEREYQAAEKIGKKEEDDEEPGDAPLGDFSDLSDLDGDIPF